MKLLFVSLLLLASGAVAQSQPTDTKDMVMVNGKFWNSLLPASKVMFLGGYKQGVVAGFVSATCGKLEDLIRAMTPLEDLLDWVEALNQFYAEPVNRAITINDATMYISVKAQGRLSSAGLDEFLVSLRRDASSAIEAAR